MRKRTYVSIYHTNYTTNETKEIKFYFDKIDKVSVDLSLTVCSSDTIRGKNKTDHAYRNQNIVNISGSFSERVTKEISEEFFKYGSNKLKNIQDLFSSFLNDGRLFYIYTRLKTYKNYVLKGFSVTHNSSVSSMDVSMTFVEVMLKNNPELYLDTLAEDFYPDILYSPPLTDATVTETVEEEETTSTPTIEKVVIDETSSVGNSDIVVEYNRIVTKVYNSGFRKELAFEVLI